MTRYISCVAAVLFAGATLQAGELDKEYGAKAPTTAKSVVAAKAVPRSPLILAGTFAADQAKASELDAELPAQAHGHGGGHGGFGGGHFGGFGGGHFGGFGGGHFGGFGGFGRGFGYGGIGRGFGYGGLGRGFGYGGYGRGFGYGGYGRGFGYGGYGLGYRGYGLGYGGFGYGLGAARSVARAVVGVIKNAVDHIGEVPRDLEDQRTRREL